MDIYSYIYDAAHNQISKTEKINSNLKGTTNNTYDILNRLLTVTEPKKSTETSGRYTQYTYDTAGNRETEQVTTSTTTGTAIALTTYKYNEQNRLMSTTKDSGGGVKEITSYIYDNNGNMTGKNYEKTRQIDPANPPKARFGMLIDGQKNGYTKNAEEIFKGTASYEFDVWNQLVKANTGEGASTYKYNAEGYRTEKTENGITTRSFYEADQVVLETDAKGKETARNIYGTNLLSRTVTAANVQKDHYYYMYNGHGDVTALLTATGTIAASYYYDAFGTAIEKNEPAIFNNPYRYAGYVFDGSTGLYYLNARYYDSKIARFMSEDTYTGEASDPLSLNLYTYCLSNPIMYTDPTGNTTAKIGTKGDTVKAIQEDLKALGYNIGKADGVFGPQTQAAVKQFQKDNGLKVDGVVGNQTITEIYFEQSKKEAKANGITLAEAPKASVGQLSGNVLIMSDGNFNVAMSNIKDLKVATNGGSVNTGTANNQLVVTKTTLGGTKATAGSVTLTPTKPIAAANTIVMSGLTKQVSGISSAISATNLSIVMSNKSTNYISQGMGNGAKSSGTGNFIDNVISIGGKVTFIGNTMGAVVTNVNDWSDTYGDIKIYNTLKDIVLPTTTEVSTAERLINQAASMGGQGVNLASGAFVNAKTVSAISAVGKVGKVFGLVGTAIAPITEWSTSSNIYADVYADAKGLDSSLLEAEVSGVTALDACSFGMARGVLNTIPTVRQLVPGEDPEWTNKWTNNVNSYVNSRFVSTGEVTYKAKK